MCDASNVVSGEWRASLAWPDWRLARAKSHVRDSVPARQHRHLVCISFRRVLQTVDDRVKSPSSLAATCGIPSDPRAQRSGHTSKRKAVQSCAQRNYPSACSLLLGCCRIRPLPIRRAVGSPVRSTPHFSALFRDSQSASAYFVSLNCARSRYRASAELLCARTCTDHAVSAETPAPVRFRHSKAAGERDGKRVRGPVSSLR